MKSLQVYEMEREEIILVGYSVVDSLKNVMESKIIGKLGEDLFNKKK